MNFTLQTLFRIGGLILIAAILTRFPWPDIEPFLYIIEYVFGFFYFFDPIVNMQALFALAILIAGIEGGLYAFDLALKVLNFINTGHWQQTQPVGEGSIGGPGSTHPRFTPGL